jgi:hypothetical protein
MEVVWRLLYDAAGVKVDGTSHAQLDEASSLCGLNTSAGGYWRGLFASAAADGEPFGTEDAPHHQDCLILLDQAALAQAMLLAVEE